MAASKWTVRDGIERQPDEQTSQSQAWQDNHQISGGLMVLLEAAQSDRFIQENVAKTRRMMMIFFWCGIQLIPIICQIE